MRIPLLLITALSLLGPASALAADAAKCKCSEKCAAACKKGDKTKCKCKHCGCAKGEKCEHCHGEKGDDAKKE